MGVYLWTRTEVSGLPGRHWGLATGETRCKHLLRQKTLSVSVILNLLSYCDNKFGQNMCTALTFMEEGRDKESDA